MPGQWKDTHIASHERFLKDVLLVGVVVQVALEDLETIGVSGVPHSLPPPPPIRTPQHPRTCSRTDTHLAGSLFLIYGPLHTIITVGYLIGCHILDVAKVTGPLGDNSCHSFLSAQVNLQPFLGTVALSCPGIDLALIVQPPQVGVPAKGTQVPRLVAAGGCYLAVRNRVILQAQGLRASCGQKGLSPVCVGSR